MPQKNETPAPEIQERIVYKTPIRAKIANRSAHSTWIIIIFLIGGFVERNIAFEGNSIHIDYEMSSSQKEMVCNGVGMIGLDINGC